MGHERGEDRAGQIELRTVSKHYGSGTKSTVALDDVSLTIEPGSFVSLLGPSGCGKTTLLNLIAGLEVPTHGTVTTGGHEVIGPSPSRGVVFQEYALFPWMSVRDNIEVGLKYQSVRTEQRRKISESLIDSVHLRGFADAYPKTLSGGMKQRVAIARAYASNPECLLLDEPFGALDAQTRASLQDDLIALWGRTKKTVVFVTHDVDEAVYMSERVILLSPRPGRIWRDVYVALPRERTRAMRGSEEFFQARTGIWDAMEQLLGESHS